MNIHFVRQEYDEMPERKGKERKGKGSFFRVSC